MSDPAALELTRQSWNVATRNHNAHKGDQAAFLREGGELLFPEELELLGPLPGKRLVHLQCNAGQDTLCLARRGAIATGVDFSDEAIAFARKLGAGSGLQAAFVEGEVVAWLSSTTERFDLAFSSYGAAGWLPDLGVWARGIERVLLPGGRFVYLEFHPLVWSLDGDRVSKDSYFEQRPFTEPVRDYVALSGAGLGAARDVPTLPNPIPATSYQHTLGAILTVLAQAGLRLETLREYPHSNGFKALETLVPGEGRRWQFAPGQTPVPLMFGVVFSKPG